MTNNTKLREHYEFDSGLPILHKRDRPFCKRLIDLACCPARAINDDRYWGDD